MVGPLERRQIEFDQRAGAAEGRAHQRGAGQDPSREFLSGGRERRPPFYLVDLPGYGYARGGEKRARGFDAIAAAYFSAGTRDVRVGGRGAGFCGVLSLVDSRHPGLDSDRSALERG